MNIYKFKSMIGEWIVGDLIDDNDEEDTFTLKSPRTLFFSPAEGGGMNVQLHPFDPTQPDGAVEFSGAYVGAHPKTVDELLESSYIEATSSLLLPKAH